MKLLRFLGLISLLCTSLAQTALANDLLIRFASLERAGVPGRVQSPAGGLIDTRAIRQQLFGANFHHGDTVVWNLETSRYTVHKRKTPTQVLAEHFRQLDLSRNIAAVLPGQSWFSFGASTEQLDAVGTLVFAGQFNPGSLVSSTAGSEEPDTNTGGPEGPLGSCPSIPPVLPPAPVITSATVASGAPGVAFSYQITASNSPSGYSASGLPPGLSLNTASGLISGTPTVDGSSSVTVRAYNVGGTGTATLTINIFIPNRVYNLNDSGAYSLRQSISDASPGDTLSFQASLDGGTISLSGARLGLDKNLTIDASALPNGITVSANGQSRVFSIFGNSNVTLTALKVTGGNVAAGQQGGGGILVGSGSQLVLNEVTVSGNTSADIGGGVANYGSMTINRSTLSGNHAANTGGGIYTQASPVSIINSTLAGNTAGNGSGAGIHSLGVGSALTLRHVTIAGNTGNTVSGSHSGAGVLSASPATLTLENTLIGDNLTGAGGVPDLQGDATLIGKNLVETYSGTLSPLGSLITADPLLAPLGNYGGLTHSLLPLTGSPVLQAAIVQASSPATDQRAFVRPYGPLPDIGALEVLPIGDAVDLPAFTWNSTGDLPWYGQTGITLDTVDAAQSGAISHNQASHVETTLTGPGKLTFRWRVSSELNKDFLYFFYDGAELPAINRISGTPGWATHTLNVAGGLHNARWSYVKNATLSAGADAAWLDQLVYTPLTTEISSALTAYGTLNQSFSYSITASNFPTSFNATGLPSGLSVNTTTGLISGTPLVEGVFNVNLSATNAHNTDHEVLTLTILAPGEVGNSNDDGHGSLRQRILDANPGDSLTFAASMDGQQVLLGGTEIVVNKNLTVDASSLPQGVRISGANLARVFSIQGNATVTLKALTVTGGKVPMGQNGGGGLFVSPGSHLVLNEVTISGNSSADVGGGIANQGTMTITASTLSGNHAKNTGGGIHTSTDAALVENSTITDNTTDNGAGAGIHSRSAGGSLVLRHVTVSNNTAFLVSGDGPGSGVWNESPATLTLENSLVADNLTKLGAASNLLGDVTAAGANLVENHSGNLLSGPAFLTADPKLTALRDHGGKTLTRILHDSSPALDAGGVLPAPLATGQRGETRPDGGFDPVPDLGAVEVIRVGEAIATFGYTNGISTRGDTVWYGQAGTHYDGLHAAQSGGIGDGESSILEFTIDGIAFLEFRWKVSSEFESDYLEFAMFDVNGVEVEGLSRRISGDVDWQDESVSIPDGLHTARWTYIKDSSGSAGMDAGWVDDFLLNLPFEIGSPIITSPLVAEGTQGSAFSYTITADNDPIFFGATGLPAGLSVDTGTGLISGTPSVDGVFNVSITAQNGDGTDLKNLELTIFTENQVENSNDSGPGSLRQLIANATAGDTLTVDASLNGKTITLGGSNLSINKNLTIDASALSKGLVISGNDLSRIFFVSGNSTLTLQALTLTGGNVSSGFGGGGAIAVTAGSHLILHDVTIRDSESADVGGGIANYGLMDIYGSTFSGNHAASSGGGLLTSANPVTIENSTFNGNTSGTSSGAGIQSRDAGSVLTLRHVTVSGNTSNTVSNNYSGAGVLSWQGAALTLENSIIGANFTGVGSVSDLEGDVTATGANIVTSHNGTRLSGAPFITSAPQLSNLGGYGGRTRSMIPLNGSPALNTAVLLGTTPADDQRDAVRPYGPSPDMGAVEVMPLAEAVDAAGLAWTTSGDVVWYGQTGLSFDAVDAAQSGGMDHNQSSHIETSISYPGTLNFRWKVSSESAYDFLQFFLNGVEVATAPKISGEVGWQAVAVSIPAGVNTVRWSYSKDFSVSKGSDAGWLDQVVMVPVAPVITSVLTAQGSQGLPFNYAITTDIPASSFAASGLPAGLSIDSVTGIISGTPAVDGVFQIGLSASNAGGTGKKTLVLTLLTQNQVENASNSGPGSMRQIILNASSGDTLTFDQKLNGSTIFLDAELLIDKDLTIDASALSAGLQFMGNGSSRVFDIPFGVTVMMDSIGISGGQLTADNDWGAGIRNAGDLTLNRVTVSGNSSSGSFADGAGIYNQGTLTINESVIAENSSSGVGGAIHNGGTLVINNSEISGSDASEGGGMYNAGSGTTAILSNVTVSGNSSVASGAGISNHFNASLTLVHTTISNNHCTGSTGGGLAISSGVIAVENSIVAGNIADFGKNDIRKDGGTLTPTGANLIGDNTSVETEFPAGSLAGTAAARLDPLLAPLQLQGGAARVMPALTGSPAIDVAVALVDTPETDQRSIPRPLRVLADIGAAESLLLDDALDTTSFGWSTGEDASWHWQSDTNHDGVDAARSTNTPNDGSSDLEVTLSGPGTLTFWWKVSSEFDFDYLQFFIDDVEQAAAPKISGEVDWQEMTVPVPAGEHVLRWSYSKDFSVSEGADRGWIDQVQFSEGPREEMIFESGFELD